MNNHELILSSQVYFTNIKNEKVVTKKCDKPFCMQLIEQVLLRPTPSTSFNNPTFPVATFELSSRPGVDLKFLPPLG
jgi:hypothetical protein